MTNKIFKQIIASFLTLIMAISSLSDIINNIGIKALNNIIASAEVDETTEALRKQAVKNWIEENITPDMSNLQKVQKVAKYLSDMTYEGGTDAILDPNGGGDCISYSESALYFFDKLGIPSRIHEEKGIWMGHVNNYVWIDGELYIVECTPASNGYKHQLDKIGIKLSNTSTVSDGKHTLLTDDKFVYWLLDDGTLEICDIIDFVNELPETLTIPNHTTINNKTYNISKIGPMGFRNSLVLYQCPHVKRIHIEDGIEMDEDYNYHTLFTISESMFPNLEEITGECSISSKNISFSQDSFIYNGSYQVPTVTIKDGDTTLNEGTDYTISIERGDDVEWDWFYRNNNSVYTGTYTMIINGKNKYIGSYSKSYKITPKSIADTDITLKEITGPYLIYDGKEKYESPIVMDGTKELSSYSDYSVTYSNNTEPGTATVTITGKRDYTGIATRTFTIRKIDISGNDCVVRPKIVLSQNSYIYDGTAKEPSVTVRWSSTGKTITQGKDYTVSYENNTEAGIATVTITGIGHYTGSICEEFQIIKPESKIEIPTITNSCIYPSGSFSMEYTGCELRPFSVKYGDTTLTEGVDYTVDYSDNTAVGTAYCTISGTGKYKGSITKTFNIIRSDISKSSINISMEDGPFYYTGEEIKPKITITDTVYDPAAKNYKTISLIEGKDYTLKYAKNIYYWDQSSAIITGIGNYSGTATKSFNITYIGSTPDLSDDSSFLVTLSKTSYIYDGTAKTPTATVKYYSTTLKENTDYTVSYSNNVNAGTATAKITGKGSYTGTLSKTYTINKASIGTGTMTLSQYSYEYDGAAKKPSATIKLGSKALVSGTDYTVSYSNNTNAGAAIVTATGTGNYSGTLNATFYITEPEVITPDPIPTVIDISDCTATLSASSYTYDGTAKTPTVTVKNDSADLVNGTDYTVSYSNNINAGTATVTITGKGTYTGTISKTFTISTANINDSEVGISATHYTYSGNACRPSIAVKNGSSILTNGVDYTVVYKNNVNVGTATVTITGKGNYSGSLEKTFTISPASISSATATLPTTFFSYTGYAKRPNITVKIGSKTLINGTDYTVTYSNNVKAGTATAKITGKGNYTGTISKNYTIKAMALSKVKVSGLPKSKYYTGKVIKPVLTLKNGTKTLKAGTDYTITYKSNKAIGKATITLKGKGNYSETVTLSFKIIPKKTGLKTVTSPKTKQIKVTYSKVTNITGYQILYSTSSDFSKNKKAVNTTATSKTISGLKKGTTYYVKVRTYKTVKGTKYYSGYSSVKKIKTK